MEKTTEVETPGESIRSQPGEGQRCSGAEAYADRALRRQSRRPVHAGYWREGGTEAVAVRREAWTDGADELSLLSPDDVVYLTTVVKSTWCSDTTG